MKKIISEVWVENERGDIVGRIPPTRLRVGKTHGVILEDGRQVIKRDGRWTTRIKKQNRLR